MTVKKRIVDIRVIALNETEHYVIDEADKEHIEMIVGVYMFDFNSCTHVCELTPSYFLRHIRDEVRLTEKSQSELTLEKQEELYDKYENEYQDDIYMHCGHVHKIIAHMLTLPNSRDRYCVEGKQELPDDTTYDEYIEEVWEDCRGNWRL